MKKSFFIVLICIMVLFSSTLVFADKNISDKNLSDNQIQKVLLKKGVTLEMQSKMSEEIKKNIANDDSIIKLVSTSQNVDKSASIESVPSGLDVRGYIFTISDINGCKAFKLYSDFSWDDNDPFAYLTDKIGIAWNIENLTVAGSQLHYHSEDCYGDGQDVDKYNPDDGSTSLYGRGYSVPLNGCYTYNKSGYMYVEVYDRNIHGSVQLSMITSYYHKNIGIDGSLSFSDSPSIGISLSTEYDTPVTYSAYYNYSTN